MSTGFISQYRSVAVSVIGAILTGLALLVVMSVQGVSERTIAASLLVLCFGVFAVGGTLFTGRHFFKWPVGETPLFRRWERGLVIASVVIVALGLALLADMLRAAGDTFLAQAGMVTYLFGAVLVVVAETTFLSNGAWNTAQVMLYVVLAFLAQAAFGAALLQTGLVAGWVGWATVIWNLGWLLIMLVGRPRDVYFPVLHVVAPLVIGLALLANGWH